MKHFIRTIILSACILIHSNYVSAQCPACDVALQRDTRDYFQTELKTDFSSFLKEIYNHDWAYYKSGAWKSNTNFQSGGAYGIISGFLDGNKTDEENQQAFNTMKASFERTQDVSSSEYQKVSQSIQSKEIYKSWVECIKACPTFDAPILTQSISGKELTVTLYWQHNNTNDRQTIRDITSGNLTPVNGGSLDVNKSIRGRNSYSKKFKIINIHVPSYVTVTMSEYPPASLIVPAVPVENLASNYPVGTIIISVLDWKRFCRVNGQPETLNYSDKNRCKWAPADGRSVVGSTYGDVENNVPDFRGVFLRGLNDFGVPGSQSINPNQTDPDPDINGNKREANSLQKEAFKNHSHLIPRGSPGDNGGLLGGNEAAPLPGKSPTDNSTTGGNETRPTNKAVYYYIKIN